MPRSKRCPHRHLPVARLRPDEKQACGVHPGHDQEQAGSGLGKPEIPREGSHDMGLERRCSRAIARTFETRLVVGVGERVGEAGHQIVEFTLCLIVADTGPPFGDGGTNDRWSPAMAYGTSRCLGVQRCRQTPREAVALDRERRQSRSTPPPRSGACDRHRGRFGGRCRGWTGRRRSWLCQNPCVRKTTGARIGTLVACLQRPAQTGPCA